MSLKPDYFYSESGIPIFDANNHQQQPSSHLKSKKIILNKNHITNNTNHLTITPQRKKLLTKRSTIYDQQNQIDLIRKHIHQIHHNEEIKVNYQYNFRTDNQNNQTYDNENLNNKINNYFSYRYIANNNKIIQDIKNNVSARRCNNKKEIKSYINERIKIGNNQLICNYMADDEDTLSQYQEDELDNKLLENLTELKINDLKFNGNFNNETDF